MSKREESVSLTGPAGLLEALYLSQESVKGIALICHPNPVKGGTMQNKVVSTLQRVARDAGLSTLRFNYRGVGNSQGEHDMQQGEVDDAQAAFEWLQQQHPKQPHLPIYLLGFSFGGFVAAELAQRLAAQKCNLKHIFLAAPAVTRLNGNFLLPETTKLTIIQPEQDEVINPQEVYDWTDQLTINYELIKVAECSHFFHGQLTALKDILAERLTF